MHVKLPLFPFPDFPPPFAYHHCSLTRIQLSRVKPIFCLQFVKSHLIDRAPTLLASIGSHLVPPVQLLSTRGPSILAFSLYYLQTLEHVQLVSRWLCLLNTNPYFNPAYVAALRVLALSSRLTSWDWGHDPEACAVRMQQLQDSR